MRPLLILLLCLAALPAAIQRAKELEAHEESLPLGC